MSMALIVQYGAIAVSIITLLVDRKGISKFFPVAMFASLYSNMWCYIADYFHLWSFQQKLFPVVQDISFIVNVIVVPIMVMIWVKHIPDTFFGKVVWAIVWTIGLTFVEFLIERYTNVLDYHNGYDWYYSLILWFFSWFIWAGYHKWQIKRLQ